MSDSVRLAFDAMSGDFGPRIAIPAALAFAESNSSAELTLFGDRAQCQPYLPSNLPPNLDFIQTQSVVPMDADPKSALRQGRGSSMWQALEALAAGGADACVSAGNSGALMLLSRRLVGVIEGVEVPAFCKAMPVERGATLMLDLGANLHCSSEQLVQFARMGSVLARSAGSQSPRVALLNIGVEPSKGTRTIRDAARQLEQLDDIYFAGFVEADDIFTGRVDVIVCDGFNGNIALKASEGVARLIARHIEKSLSRGWGRLAGLAIWPIVRRWRTELNPDAYNGAAIAGLNATVVKSHGGAGVEATVKALHLAFEQARFGVPARIASALKSNSL